MTRFFVLATFFCASLSHAWGDLGHETVGAIAEMHLTPQAKQGVRNVLGIELLSIAAIWPDQARDDKRLDPMKPYHYVTVPSGKTYESLLPQEKVEQDAYTVISQFPKLIKKGDEHVRRIALKYLIHVIGDVHQPLHVGHPYDRGGNLCFVIWSEKSREDQELHKVWDGALVNSLNGAYFAEHKKTSGAYYTTTLFALDLLKNANLSESQKQKIAKASPFVWFKESQELRGDVYPDNGVKYKDEERRPYCKMMVGNKLEPEKIEEDKIPVLTPEYREKGTKIVEKQLVAAGLRLANALNEIFKKTDSGPSESEILSPLLLKNKIK